MPGELFTGTTGARLGCGAVAQRLTPQRSARGRPEASRKLPCNDLAETRY